MCCQQHSCNQSFTECSLSAKSLPCFAKGIHLQAAEAIKSTPHAVNIISNSNRGWSPPNKILVVYPLFKQSSGPWGENSFT